MGVDAELLELSWNNSKPTPCLLVRPTYQATSHHAAAAACVLNARAPLGVTHHTNERARETSTTAPPCPPPTRSTRGTGRAIANEPGFVSRVVVVVVSSAVVGRVFGSSTEELNGGRHRCGKLKYPALGVCFYVPSVICPGPIRLCPAQNDQKGVRATTGKLGIFLIWVFCRRPQFSCLITHSQVGLGPRQETASEPQMPGRGLNQEKQWQQVAFLWHHREKPPGAVPAPHICVYDRRTIMFVSLGNKQTNNDQRHKR